MGPKFLQQDTQGPAIADDVVQAQDQPMVLLTEAQKHCPKQLFGGQVERTSRLTGREPFRLRARIRKTAQIHFQQRPPLARRHDHLLRLSLHRGETRPQSLVTPNDRVQAGSKSRNGEGPGEFHSRGHVVGRAGR